MYINTYVRIYIFTLIVCNIYYTIEFQNNIFLAGLSKSV